MINEINLLLRFKLQNQQTLFVMFLPKQLMECCFCVFVYYTINWQDIHKAFVLYEVHGSSEAELLVHVIYRRVSPYNPKAILRTN